MLEIIMFTKTHNNFDSKKEDEYSLMFWLWILFMANCFSPVSQADVLDMIPLLRALFFSLKFIASQAAQDEARVNDQTNLD